eukprot:TRINITY_DN22178_c0_g1_i1.p1 TRINITY_DN22178_c0_g1~~TRINITY_DN22178_c0_g1_i1.p1  ORF type:complete len:815 (-),score=223.72 TRINITY_DN22178_c0_g1_i1:77-2521(-)
MEEEKKKGLLVLYGSQTGNAESIGQRIFTNIQNTYKTSFEPLVYESMAKFMDIPWEKIDYAVVIVSSTGQGDLPDNCIKFWTFLRKKSEDWLKHCKYALLGLGDSNYATFQAIPKKLDAKLLSLGATKFLARGEADDATGLEDVVEPWIDDLFECLNDIASGNESNSTDTPTPNVDPSTMKSTDTAPTDVTNSTNPNPIIYVPEVTSVNPILSPIVNNTNSTSNLNSNSESPIISPSTPFLHDKSSHPSSNSISSSITNTPLLSSSIPSTPNLVSTPNLSSTPSTPYLSSTPSTPFLSSTPSTPLLSSTPSTPSLTPSTKRIIKVKEFPDPIICTISLDFTPSPSFIPAPVIIKPHKNARFVSSRLLTATDYNFKPAHEITLELAPEDAWNWVPGDSFAIHCPNNATEVKKLISLLNYDQYSSGTIQLHSKTPLNGSEKIKIKIPTHLTAVSNNTLYHILTHEVDIRYKLPTKSFLRTMSQFCSTESEKQTILSMSSSKSKPGIEMYNTLFKEQFLTLIEFFEMFPSCKPPLDHLLCCLPPLLPRYYSLSCAPISDEERNKGLGLGLDNFKTLKFAYKTIEFEVGRIKELGNRDRIWKGLCTTYLDECISKQQQQTENKQGEYLSVKVAEKKSGDFKIVEEDIYKPLIMIGPGVGVAPFISFLEYKQHIMRTRKKDSKQEVKKEGKWTLFFGCRYEQKDFLYEKELKDFERNKVLTELVTAFSRDENEKEEKVYVQSRMRERGKEICDAMMKEGGKMYICGDAKGMGKEVRECVVSIIEEWHEEEGGRKVDKVEAMKILVGLMEQKRILMDVWT